MVRTKLAIWMGKLTLWLLQLLGKTGGTWPGEVALRIDPTILQSLTRSLHVILVAGTNGKTTTTKLIDTILTKAGEAVVTNLSGANLDNGLVSVLLDLQVKTNGDTYAVFEVDEMTLERVASQLRPKVIVLLNLFRDQLDRYGEVDTIARSWKRALSSFPSTTVVIANGDDPQVVDISFAAAGEKLFFGLDNPKYYLSSVQHATDSIFCPRCGERLHFAGFFFSHLGKWDCPACRFRQPKLALSSRAVRSPLEGVYNIYNVAAASLTAQRLGISSEVITHAVASFVPAFGRQETVEYDGKTLKLLLSKNPTGFNESLRTVFASRDQGPMLLVLNDHIPDGRDVSWIWDVDFELIGYTMKPRLARDSTRHDEHVIVVSGTRALDLGVRLKYAGIEGVVVEEDLQAAVNMLAKHVKPGETGWVLPTYSAMLQVRKIITGNALP